LGEHVISSEEHAEGETKKTDNEQTENQRTELDFIKKGRGVKGIKVLRGTPRPRGGVVGGDLL